MMGNGTINKEYVDNGREPVIKIGKIDLCNYSIKLYGRVCIRQGQSCSIRYLVGQHVGCSTLGLAAS